MEEETGLAGEEFGPGLAGVDGADGELAVWLEECGTKLRKAAAGEEQDPREAAAGVLGLAAAVAPVARKLSATNPPRAGGDGGGASSSFSFGVPSRSAGSRRDGAGAGAGAAGAGAAAVDEEGVARVRRELMRRTRDALTRSLAAIGVLETLEGD